MQNTDSTFLPEDLYTYVVEFPLTGSLGLTLVADMDIGLHLIANMHQNSHFKLRCKKSYHIMSWIVQVHNDEPIKISQMIEYISFLQDQQIKKIKVLLCHFY